MATNPLEMRIDPTTKMLNCIQWRMSNVLMVFASISKLEVYRPLPGHLYLFTDSSWWYVTYIYFTIAVNITIFQLPTFSIFQFLLTE